MCSFGSCQTRFEFLSQFRKVRNAFECFVTQVQTHLPKNQTRLAYEDTRDLYCIYQYILRLYGKSNAAQDTRFKRISYDGQKKQLYNVDPVTNVTNYKAACYTLSQLTNS